MFLKQFAVNYNICDKLQNTNQRHCKSLLNCGHRDHKSAKTTCLKLHQLNTIIWGHRITIITIVTIKCILNLYLYGRKTFTINSLGCK